MPVIFRSIRTIARQDVAESIAPEIRGRTNMFPFPAPRDSTPVFISGTSRCSMINEPDTSRETYVNQTPDRLIARRQAHSRWQVNGAAGSP